MGFGTAMGSREHRVVTVDRIDGGAREGVRVAMERSRRRRYTKQIGGKVM